MSAKDPVAEAVDMLAEVIARTDEVIHPTLTADLRKIRTTLAHVREYGWEARP